MFRKITAVLLGLGFAFNLYAQESGLSIEEMLEQIERATSTSKGETASKENPTTESPEKRAKVAPVISATAKELISEAKAVGKIRVSILRRKNELWNLTELLCDMGAHDKASSFAKKMLTTRVGGPRWKDFERDITGSYELLAARVLSGMGEWRAAKKQIEKHKAILEDAMNMRKPKRPGRRGSFDAEKMEKIRSILEADNIERLFKYQTYVINLEDEHAELDELEANYAEAQNAESLKAIIDKCAGRHSTVDAKLRWLTASSEYLAKFPEGHHANNVRHTLADAYNYFALHDKAIATCEFMQENAPDFHKVTNGDVAWNIIMFQVNKAEFMGQNNKTEEALRLLMSLNGDVKRTAKEYPEHWRSEEDAYKVKERIEKVKSRL